MKKATTINEQIDRILAVSDYKIQDNKRTLVESVTPKIEIGKEEAPKAETTTEKK